MPDSDPLIRHFEDILADPAARPATKVAAGKELARLREREPATDQEPLGTMQEIVERYCPQSAEDRGLPADPMRGLDYETFTGEKLDPVAASSLPYCRPKQVAQVAARRVWRLLAGSMRATGLTSCPMAMTWPSGDASASQAERRELYNQYLTNPEAALATNAGRGRCEGQARE